MLLTLPRTTGGIAKMINNGLHLFIIIFACFRLTRLLCFDVIIEWLRKPFHHITEEEQEDGTIEEFVEIKGTGVRRFIGLLLSCYWCTGVWCAIFLYAGYMLLPALTFPVITILAIAGAASLLEATLEKFY
jgi:hypothetical protein